MHTVTLNRHMAPLALPQRLKLHSRWVSGKAIDLARRPFRPLSERIFFLHIPKCGGTSLKHAIANCYKSWWSNGSSKVIWLDDRAAAQAIRLSERNYWQVKRDLLAYSLSKAGAKCVMGHFVFGNEIFQAHRNDWHFVTLVRHPVDRWFSDYFYNRVAPGPYGTNDRLEDFLSSRRALEMANPLVMHMTEDDNLDRIHTRESIQLTIDRLRQFSLIGTLEDINGFTSAFERKFAHRLRMPRRNVNPPKNRPKDSPVTREIRRRVTEMCEPDLRVYRALFD